MRINDFRKILELFSDPGSEIEFQGRILVAQIHGDLIELDIQIKEGEVYVKSDSGGVVDAAHWVMINLAKIDVLCDRLLQSIKKPEPFVVPNCDYMFTLEVDPNASQKESNALEAFDQIINNQSPLETTVIYLTSDAGEGKTTLIQYIARNAAERFRAREGNFLIIPIALGGRPFIGFDDLVVGTLLNELRFGFYYYGAFLELVKMGLIIPALDGFEEMFVIKSGGEASSALGSLVHDLCSEGTVIVSARRAYFDYQNLANQSRLLESFGQQCVGFSRISLKRWTKEKFIKFFEGSGFNSNEAQQFYNAVSDRVGIENAILCRPVFVQKLAELAESSDSFEEFLRQLSLDESDPFEPLIYGILHREAHTKWLYRTKDLSKPLLSINQHIGMLSDIASEMWDSSVSILGVDVIEMIVEIYGERENLSSTELSQAKERIKGHALLIPSGTKGALQFDHDEFYWYFLAEVLFRMSMRFDERGLKALRQALRKGQLPNATVKRFGGLIRNQSKEIITKVIYQMQDLSHEESRASFASENLALIVRSVIQGLELDKQISLNGFSFAEGALRDAVFTGIRFEECFFPPTRLGVAKINDCTFVRCHFVKIEIDETLDADNIIFDDCKVDGILDRIRNTSAFESESVAICLKSAGIELTEAPEISHSSPGIIQNENDFCCGCVEKLLRIFSSSSHLSENLIQMKFGTRAGGFMAECLPRLLEIQVLEEVLHYGRGNQKQYRLSITLVQLQAHLDQCNGDFDTLLRLVAQNSRL